MYGIIILFYFSLPHTHTLIDIEDPLCSCQNSYLLTEISEIELIV